jgi:long-chain acyl-CoA synthetase
VNRPELLRSCGRPYPWVEVRIVEPSTGEDVPVGDVGELWTRSRQNMAGYWNNPKATAEALHPRRLVQDGRRRLHRRRRLPVPARPGQGHDRVGGENVYPAEVENVVASTRRWRTWP